MRGKVATRALAASALVVTALTGPWAAPSASAGTGGVGPLRVTCTGQGVAAPAQSQVSSITASAPRDSVAEDDLLPVTLATALPALPPGLAITGAHLTLPIPVDVSNVDLSFSGGTIEARSWDARSGTEIVVNLVSPEPLAPGAVQVPDIVVSYAFDMGSAGRTVHWPAFAAMVTDVVAEDGATGTVTCRPTTTPPTLLDTALTAPAGLQRRGPITMAEPLPPGGAVPAPAGGVGGSGSPAPAGRNGPGATVPGAGRGTSGTAAAPGGSEPGGGAGADGTGGGAGSAGSGSAEALTQPVNLFLMAAVALTGFSAAVLFTRRRQI